MKHNLAAVTTVALSFLCLVVPASAQSTLGLTLPSLRSLYEHTRTLGAWKQGTTNDGRSYAQFVDRQNNLVVVSYFAPTSAGARVVTTAVSGPAEPFLGIFINKCDSLYPPEANGAWLDSVSHARITVEAKAGVATMRFAAQPK